MLLVSCGKGGSESTSDDADQQIETAADEAADTDHDETHDHDDTHGLEEIDFLSDYSIEDPEYGTLVSVTIDEGQGTRTIVSNALPDHETGDFPNEANPNTISEQDESWTFPLVPEYVGEATSAMVPAIAFNGVKFQPNTAEQAVCDSGITYNIEAIGLSGLVDIPQGLDFNNAHVQPWGEYHYHGVPESVIDNSPSDGDLAFVGFAADGHLIYHSQSDAYASSYFLGTDDREGTNCIHAARSDAEDPVSFGPTKDGSLAQDWEFYASYGDLDECNGILIAGEYVYLVTETYPYVPRCVMGVIDEASAGDGGDRQEPPDGQGDQPAEGEDRPERPAPGDDAAPERPDIATAAAALGITEQELTDAVVGNPPDFAATAANLGLPVEDVEDAFR